MEEKRSPNYVLAIREHWRLLAAVVVLAVGAAVAYAVVAQKRYEATSDLLVSPVSSDTLVGLPLLRESLFGRSVVTVSRLATSPEVVARVRKRLKLAGSDAAIKREISVTPQEQSDIVSISATADTPEEAARVANAFAQALVDERSARLQAQLQIVIGQLRNRLRTVAGRPGDPEAEAIASRLADYRALVGDKDPTLDIVSAASPPLTPAWPKPVLGVVVAGMIGLLLGIALVVGLEMSSPVVRRLDSLRERGGPPILTRMPQLSADDTRAALVDPVDVPDEIRASVRTLWANLGQLPTNREKAGMLLVTSAGDPDDSAPPAVLLATLMARAGMRIMLIDADMDRGPLSAIFDGDIASVASLGHSLERGENGSTGDTAPRTVVPSRLRVLLDDPEDRHLTKWMPPERISALVERLRDEVDAVVVSGPPPPAAETTVLAELADAVVITVSLGRTRREQLAAVRTAFENRGVVPAGYVVLERRSLLTRVIRRSEQQPTTSRRWT